MNKPEVTVIVCSYNRADSLRGALKSLASLNTIDFSYEVLVVDNASTDHTPDVVQKASEDTSDCSIRYVLEEQPGVSFARNRGVAEAHGQWFAFFDDDELADPNWLVELLKVAKENQVKCVGGGINLRLINDAGENITDQRTLKPWVRVMFNDGNAPGEELGKFYNRKDTPGTGNMLIHREIFDRIGLFRTDLVEGGEDTDLFHRMREAGFQACHAKDAVVHHQIPEFRLEPKYMKAASLRMGSHVARREYREYGLVKFILMIVARAGQTVLLHGSRLLLAVLSGDKEAILERKCKWWLGQGYLQAAFGFLLYKEKVVSKLEFRSERKPESTS